jgi:membrane protease YdiL (CAAX protease family)
MLSYIFTYGLLFFYYGLFFIAVSTAAKSGSGQLKDVLERKGEAGILFSRLLAGIFFLGIGVAVLFEQRELDKQFMAPAWNGNESVWILTAAALIVGVSSALKKPTINNSHHSLPAHLPLSFILLRTLFLIVYEFFFRGIMLVIMTEDMGVVTAIIFNVTFYALVHWFDKKERYGSLVMGIVLCGVTIYYYSVWPAVIIHLSLALGHEITLLIKHKSSIKRSWL